MAENNAGTTGKIKSEDISLFYRYWEGQADKPVLLFVHGLGEHSGRYLNPVNFFSQRGYTIYAYDHRGHGRSSGHRAYAERFARFVGDLERVITFVKRQEGNKPIFLVGHSFGGQVVLTYGAMRDTGVAGIIASSPNLRLAMQVPWLKKRAALALSYVTPTLAMDSGLSAQMISRDPEVVEAYDKDPLVNHALTVRLGAEMLSNQEKMPQYAKGFTLPCLLQHGEADQISDVEGTKAFYQSCSSQDKAFKAYPENYHELFNDLDKQEVFSDMDGWLKQHGA